MIALELPPPPGPAPSYVQQVADDTAAWLRGIGFGVPGVQVRFRLPDEDEMARGIAAVAPEGAIEVIGQTGNEWIRGARAALRRRTGDSSFPATLIHELLHQVHGKEAYAELHVCTVADEAAMGCSRIEPIEEGVVEAVARDLIAPWTGRFYGWADPNPATWGVAYAPQVIGIRLASARACQSTWTTYCARRWRKELLLAPPAERAKRMHACAAFPGWQRDHELQTPCDPQAVTTLPKETK